MSTTNKNYPLIKETDSTGQPLNAYDQLVTESNNFRRAVDKDINEIENELTTLNQNIDSVHQKPENAQNINTIFTNMKGFSTTRIHGYSSDTSRGHPVTNSVAYWVCTITRMGTNYGQAIFTTRSQSYVGGWNFGNSKFTWKEIT